MTELPIIRSFSDEQGIEIKFYEWPVADPKAVIQIAHGLGEHARRYDQMAAVLNRAGFSVYADDQETRKPRTRRYGCHFQAGS